MTARVVLSGPEPNGLAEMLARLLEANLSAEPSRERWLRPAVVEITAADAEVRATVRISSGRVEVVSGPPDPSAQIRVRARAQDLLALAATPILIGLPDPFRREGRRVLGRVLRGRIRIDGMLRHPVVLSRFARLLSVS